LKKIILLSCFLTLVSCSTQLYVPVATINNISTENLSLGRETYVKKCASCHHLYSPTKYNEQKWAVILKKMQRKAKISDDQTKLIYDYLVNAPKNK